MGMLLARHRTVTEAPAEEATEAPAKSASKADWHAYALSQGYTEEGLDGRTRDELRDLFNY